VIVTRVYSERYAGQSLVMNDALVEFGPDGWCRGIVAMMTRFAEPLSEPIPLRPQEIEHCRQFPDRYVLYEEPEEPVSEPADEVAAAAVEDAVQDAVGGAPAEDAVEAVVRVAPPVKDTVRTAPTGSVSMLMRRSLAELQQIATDCGIEVPEGATKRVLAELIVDDYHRR